MNRGYDGNKIFSGKDFKSQFLDYLTDAAKKMKIRIFAYCVAFIDGLFGSREELISALRSNVNQELTVTDTKYGDILGSESFMKSALKKYNRRDRPTGQSSGTRRIDERNFEPVEKVVWEFERLVGTEIEKVDTKRLEGKRLRGELLVHLKDRAGLKYKEIGEFEIFQDLSFVSLRSIYRNMKQRKPK